VAVFYALFVGRVVYRSLHWRMLPGILARSALMTASVLIIVAMSAALRVGAHRVARAAGAHRVDRRPAPVAAGIPLRGERAAAGVRHLHRAAAGIVVLVPILAPIAHALGIDDLQFGILVIVNLTMGMITPPVGGLLFVTSIVAKVPLARLTRELWPFLAAQIGVLILLSLVPALSAWLPNALGYR
jgi:TRAP-type C4-dicarboxylate transport system permease large subunit